MQNLVSDKEKKSGTSSKISVPIQVSVPLGPGLLCRFLGTTLDKRNRHLEKISTYCGIHYHGNVIDVTEMSTETIFISLFRLVFSNSSYGLAQKSLYREKIEYLHYSSSKRANSFINNRGMFTL